MFFRYPFGIEPRFSIIVPLYETPLEYFAEMLDSVLAQTYSRFELVLVNASPGDSELKQAVQKACAADSRIRRVELDDNYGIPLNTNEGIKTVDFHLYPDAYGVNRVFAAFGTGAQTLVLCFPRSIRLRSRRIWVFG